MGDAFEDALYREPRLGVAVDLARRAGRMALDQFERAPVSWKTDGSMVTTADLEIQAMLKEELRAAFPLDPVLGEEEPDTTMASAPAYWAVDPIDGTNNFGRGIPGFSISIGLIEAGWPSVGVVYDPLADQLFAGLGGWGAWLERPAPSARADGTILSIALRDSHAVHQACPGLRPGVALPVPAQDEQARPRSRSVTWPRGLWPSRTTTARRSGTSREPCRC